ncbi:hypothetical protein IAD21_05031 [Abditibacteriota bacterium]|nr:hypothetical protein IAD21_05031 [Abditibacteriota bacterium]
MKFTLKFSHRKWLVALALMGAVSPVILPLVPAHAVEPKDVNPKAMEDLKGFFDKAEEGNALFTQKKYAESAAAFAAGNALYVRAMKRDGYVDRLGFTINAGAWPSFRYYGYGQTQNPDVQELPDGKIQGNTGGFHAAILAMWQDAAILSGAQTFPFDSRDANGEPEMTEMSEDHLDSVIRFLYRPAAQFELPVRDDQWKSVLLWSRHAKLILDYAAQKYPAWKTADLNWGTNDGKSQINVDEAIAHMNKNIAEAEPELKDVTAKVRATDPTAYDTIFQSDMGILNEVLAGVNKDGYMKWDWIINLYITKDFMTERRKMYAKMWADDGKTMPPAKIAPLEKKYAAIKAAIEKNAPRWSFPAGKTHDATIEARSKSAINFFVPGATVYKTALATDGWGIVKDDNTGLPDYRQRAVMLLIRKPGEKWAWLVMGSYMQDYAGGGTYNSAGKFSPFQGRVQKPS